MGCSAKAWAQADLLHGGRTLLSFSPRECGEQAYLDFTQLELYVRDALAQVLEHRPANPQQVLHDCIERTALGRQCAGRDFTFVSANARNMLAFVQLVHEAYAKFRERRESLLSIAGFHQLLLLLCPDLPLKLVERRGRRQSEMVAGGHARGTPQDEQVQGWAVQSDDEGQPQCAEPLRPRAQDSQGFQSDI